jgi:hypothetical protein
LSIPVRIEQAEQQLTQLRGDYESRVHLKTRVLAGTAARIICETAQKEAMDGVILCSHGDAGIAHTTIGSVAERVSQEAPCQVLIIKIPKDVSGQFVMARVQHKLDEILVGYDRKAGAELALSAAIDLAKCRHSAELVGPCSVRRGKR